MKKRLIVILGDSLLLTFLGLIYAWSVFKKPLAAANGWNDSQLTWTFTICMFLFCLGGFAGAKISQKISQRTATWICGAVIGISFVLLGYIDSLWQLYVLYGVAVGFSTGIIYNCVLSTGNKWFPDKAGLIAGLLLMFFGAGSLILSPVSNYLISSFGLKTAFLIIGIAFAIIVFLAGFCVVSPTKGELNIPMIAAKSDKVEKQYTPKQMIKTSDFWFYFIWCMLGTAIGIAVVGQVFTVSSFMGLNDSSSALIVSLFAVSSGIGRFCFGYFYDRKGRLLTTVIISVMYIIGGISFLFGLEIASIVLVTVGFFFIGTAYGAVTPTNANFARSFFGNENYPTNFSIINFNLLIAVFLGQFIGSTLYMKTGGYTAMAAAVTITSVILFAVQFFIGKRSNDLTSIAEEK